MRTRGHGGLSAPRPLDNQAPGAGVGMHLARVGLSAVSIRVNIGSYRERQTTRRRHVLAKGQFFATFFGLSCLRMSGSNPSVVSFGVLFTPAENSTLMSPSQIGRA